MRLDPLVSMALGYDWLSQRNPLIDWRTGTITFPADTQTEKEATNTPTSASPSPSIPLLNVAAKQQCCDVASEYFSLLCVVCSLGTVKWLEALLGSYLEPICVLQVCSTLFIF